ncbi:MAG: hypothetical protein HUJ27_01455 [Rhodobacteraceae bacterium]|nr:hypothetical protein [Paracoccaceae bacterium]
MTAEDQIDKTGLIREAYQIDGIGAAECRSIFLDWAIKLPADIAPREAIQILLDRYAQDAPDHPMTQVLNAGLAEEAAPRRRGGRRARLDG